MVEVRYFGQSCFELYDGYYRLLFDPYLPKNHSQRTRSPGCTQTTFWSAMGMRIMSVMRWRCPSTTMRRSSQRRSLDIFWKKEGCRKTELLHIGGRITYRSARSRRHRLCTAAVRFPAAWHAASGADRRQDDLFCRRYRTVWRYAAAWAVESDRLRFSADRRSVYNGSEDAALAAGFLKASCVIPMHYNGNEKTMQDPESFRRMTEESTMQSRSGDAARGNERDMKRACRKEGSVNEQNHC